MADGVSAGAVTLEMRLNDKEFLKQIAKISAEASKILSNGLAPVNNIDFSKIEKSIDNMGNKVVRAVGETTKAVDILADTINKNISDSIENGVKAGVAGATKATSRFTMPKIKVELDKAQLERELKLYADRWKAIDDQRKNQAKIVSNLRGQQAGLPVDSKAYADITTKLLQAEKKLQDLKFAANQADQQVVQLERTINNLGDSSPKIQKVADTFKKSGGAAKVTTTQATKGLNETTKSAKQAERSVGGLSKGLQRAGRIGLALIGVRTIFAGIRRIVSATVDNFRVMAKTNTAFAGQLNMITNAFNTLKGSFAAAVAPLVQMLIPVLQKVVEWLTKAFNALAVFFGALAGKKSVQIAVGSTKQFTKELGSATKAVEKHKRSLAGFDELEILHPKQPDAGGGGAGETSGGEPIFKEVPTGLGKIGTFAKGVIDNIKQWLQDLSQTKAFQILANSAKRAWERIKTSARDAAVRVSKSWTENSPRIFNAWKNLTGKIGNLFANLAGYVFIPLVSGAVEAGVGIGASLIDNLLSTFASFSEFADAALSPFIDSINEFWDEHGPEVEEKIVGTWRTIKDGISGILDGIGELFRTVFGGLTEWFNENGEEIKTFFVGVWNDIWAIVGPIWDFILETAQTIFGALRDFFYEIAPKIKNVVVSAVDTAWKIIKPIWETISTVAKTIFGALQTFWETWGENIKGFFSGIWESIKLIFGGALNVISEVFQLFGNLFEGDWEGVWDNVKNIASTIWETITGVFESAFDGIRDVLEIFGEDVVTIWDSITGVFSGIIDFLENVFAGDWEAAWESIAGIFASIWDGLVALIKAPINLIIDILNFFIGALNKIKIPDWVPLIGGYGIDIPLIPKLARGGIIDQPTVAMIGEQGAEAVMPLERNLGWLDTLADKLGSRMDGVGGGGDIHLTIPIYLGNDTLIDVVETTIDRESRRRNAPVF